MLRSSVTAHEREVAERATLVTQERLIKAKVRHRPPALCTKYRPLVIGVVKEAANLVVTS